jgi:hypothetical protein
MPLDSRLKNGGRRPSQRPYGKVGGTKNDNWMNDKIAVNRYRLFGQYDPTHLPSTDHLKRFLKANVALVR